jgi:hypothetical protein
VKTPREVVQDWVAAYNRRDAHAEAELCHEDATNLQVALGEPTIGRQAILDNLLFHAFPDSFTRTESPSAPARLGGKRPQSTGRRRLKRRASSRASSLLENNRRNGCRNAL